MPGLLRTIGLGGVGIAALVVTFATLLQSGGKVAADVAPRAALPLAGPLTNRVVGPGRVEPDGGEVDIASEIPGVLTAVNVHEGDLVKKGAILATLGNADLKAAVARAEAAVQLKSAGLDKLVNGPRPDEIRQAEASLSELKHNLAILGERLDHQKSLKAGGFTPAVTLDEAQSAYDQGAARAENAAASLDLLKAGSRKEDIDAARADLDLAKADLETARANYEKSILRAPFDGTVLRRYREAGASVAGQGSTPVLQLGDLSHLVVRTQIDETDIAAPKIGATTEIRVPAYGEKRFTGHVARITPRLGAKTVTTDAPTEKRDARVQDVIVALDAGQNLPVGLRVDCFIDKEN